MFAAYAAGILARASTTTTKVGSARPAACSTRASTRTAASGATALAMLLRAYGWSPGGNFMGDDTVGSAALRQTSVWWKENLVGNGVE